MDRDVEPGLHLELVQRLGHARDVLVRAVERGAEDADDADRVLVAGGGDVLGVQRGLAGPDRDLLGLDLPVAAELVPADLDVGADDQVGPVGGSAGLLLPLLPAPLQGQAGEHAGLGGADGGAADRVVGLGGVPEVGDDVEAAVLELCGLRVLVAVDEVLVRGLGHQLLGLRLHPGGAEGRDVEPGVPVEHQLVHDHVVRRLRVHGVLGHPASRDVDDGAVPAELGSDVEPVLEVAAGGVLRHRWPSGRTSVRVRTGRGSADPSAYPMGSRRATSGQVFVLRCRRADPSATGRGWRSSTARRHAAPARRPR